MDGAPGRGTRGLSSSSRAVGPRCSRFKVGAREGSHDGVDHRSHRETIAKLTADASDVSGKARHLTFGSGGKPVVLYAFAPTCGWCAKNLSNIKEIYRLKHPEFEFIGVSLSPNGVPEYISRSGFPLDVMKDPSAASREKFHLNGTPETIVVDNSGIVKQVWLGAYTSDTCRKVEQFFQMPKGSLKAAS